MVAGDRIQNSPRILTLLAWFFFSSVIFGVGGVYFLSGGRPPHFARRAAPLPDYGMAPDFLLTDQSGKAWRREDLAGKVWIADFVFTRCAGQCPLMNHRTQSLRTQLPNARFVSFTADPEFDTPSVLSEYAARLGADPPQSAGGSVRRRFGTDPTRRLADPRQWLFLTGDRKVLGSVASGLHLTKIDEPMFHSVSYVLIDARLKIRGFYNALDSNDLERLRRDVRRLPS